MPWFRCDTCTQRFYTAATTRERGDDECPLPSCPGHLVAEQPHDTPKSEETR